MNKAKDKVAIMTWYTYRNYGTALQASALSNIIKQADYEPEFIQYEPKGQVREMKNISLIWLVKKLLAKLNTGAEIYISEEKERLFSEFLGNRIKETEPCRSYPELYELNDEYSAFVCGSDQIWSPLCYDDKYFLSFVNNTDKMVAYAPSIGSYEIANLIIKEKIKNHISRFKNLSIRENQGAEIIKQLTDKEAKVVLDPTLLMDSNEWDIYAETKKCSQINKDYIICYFLGDDRKYMDYVKAISKVMNMPFYVIPHTQKQKKGKNAVPFEVGPSEFVSLISNAKYVCTDSFHGMAFAVNYNIPFSVFKRFSDNDKKNQNSRIFNLLKILRLEDRLADYKNTKNLDKMVSCDFSKANLAIDEQRKTSKQYLTNSLDNAKYAGITNVKPYKITDMCCGCGACASVCPQKAVSVENNEDGFFNYHIDNEKCVECGICQEVCPMSKITAEDIINAKNMYSAKSSSDSVLAVSSSGGIGHELADYCQKNDAYVIGCIYDTSSNAAKHIIISPTETENLSLIQGSKYIQSDTREAMLQLGELAKSNNVIFFGTPCQVAAADKILCRKNIRENAILVDLICHGVPSQHLWDKYIQSIDRKYGIGKMPNVLFRNKKMGWRNMTISVVGEKNSYNCGELKDDFYAFFRRGLCYMEACTDCPYREKSAADIRIGDYWGERFVKDKTGVSMVIANTKKGNGLLEEIFKKGICIAEERDIKEYWSVQFPYNQLKPLIREQLIKELKEPNIDLQSLRKRYCKAYDQREKLANIYKIIRKMIKRG